MTSVQETVQNFFADGVRRELAAGELLLLPDTTKLAPISYLVSGRVVQYDIKDDGGRSIVNIFKPGAFFPLPVAINQSSVAYFFEADVPVVVHQKSAAEVRQFLQHEPEVVYDVLSRVYRGLDGMLGRMTKLLDGDARGRVLYELYILSERFGVAVEGGTDIAITAGRLAEMTGLTRETVSRTLKVLEHDGALRHRRGAITLLT